MAERRQYEDPDISDGPSSSSTKATAAFIQGTGGDVHVIVKDQAKLEVVLDQSTSRHQDVNYRRLKAVINRHTEQETACGIGEDFKNEILCEPDFEVFPQMKKVEVADYYKGRFREENPSAAQTSREIIRRSSQSELIEEIGFHRQQDNNGKWMTIEELMESISKTEGLRPRDVVGYTAVVASAGSGKTTLMRRIARKALEISPVKEEGECAPSQPKRKMIHYIELKNMEEESGIKTSKFLFDGLFRNESEEDKAFEWLVENQSEAIIIFDGLDQMKWDFEECGVRNIKPYQKASSAIIMYNILSRKILRHVKIIVSSREFKVSELPAEVRPEEIITLNGLTLQDAYKLFTFLLCEKGQYLWKRIEIMSPRLLQLLSVPVFLILIAVVMGIDPKRPPPSTVTELYCRILLLLQSVKNIRNHKEILSIINKLKAMAFKGMEEGRVIFYKADLDQFELSADEVQDLMTKVPDTNILSHRLMEGDFTFFFCHQSMQEFLAASFISEMELEKFSRFDGQHLHGKRWSVVQRFVAGIVYMKSTSDLHRVSDQTPKRHILVRSIRSRLQKTGKYDGYACMELYTAIYESGDDILLKDLSVINASRISLNSDEAHIAGSLAARNQSLRSLNLSYCSIDDELLSIIARCLENRIRVKEVDLRYNKFSATALRSLLGHREIESLSGKLDWEVVKLTVDEWDVELKNEEDVIKISGDQIEGHFDFKDSTLSFKKVPSVALEYFSDLFDTKFVNLIEKLLVHDQEDGLRTLSEYGIEKVKEVNLPGKFSPTALRSLLRHRRIESLSGKLDWEVVKVTVDGWWIVLKNEEDVINISGRWIEGHFDFKDSTLSFKKVVSVAAVKYVSDLFDAKFIKFIEELFVQEDGLRELSKYRIEKMKEVDLRENNVSATALRSLLGHRRIESLSGKLVWEVVKLTVDGGDVELKSEEDVIKISGGKVGGHFDFKDSTLSFKMVGSVATMKYVSDLFDAKFVKLIEELFVQEDSMRELSEYRIEKVKVVDWRKVPATALHSFFGHRRIESLSEKLDWEVVKLTVDDWVVELKNEEDVIKISGGNITGHFNIKDSTLSFKIVHSLAAVEFFIKLFDTEFVKMIKELYVEPVDLRELLECKVEKISKIVLDRTKENIDWSMIETCWKKYQLDVLDIAVNGEIPVDDYKLILERGRAISVPLHIHAMFYVGKADEFRKTLEACQRKKIEYVRCILWDPVTLDQILLLINNSNLKNVTLIYKWDHEMLTGDKLRKAQKIASDLDTELEVLKLDPEGDALQRIDLRFLLEEVGEDKALHATALIAYGSLQSSSSKLKLEV